MNEQDTGRAVDRAISEYRVASREADKAQHELQAAQTVLHECAGRYAGADARRNAAIRQLLLAIGKDTP